MSRAVLSYRQKDPIRLRYEIDLKNCLLTKRSDADMIKQWSFESSLD